MSPPLLTCRDIPANIIIAFLAVVGTHIALICYTKAMVSLNIYVVCIFASIAIIYL